MTFRLQPRSIDLMSLRLQLADPACGGFASFEGWVRNENEGKSVLRLEYEAYPALAKSEGSLVVDEALQKFDIKNAVCAHRSGELQIGELAVWVGVSAPHRNAAFEACQYIIDQIKQRLPVWKKEYYADGEVLWVNCASCASAKSA
ncbi:MAG: molybdenum cofactor biosynthesis protein MoaE [Gammaproteobacteria bacterium]|nr:molybdenum cofactor biosynthesis protein MoaE [Gammaproteobacteria bacterium]